MSYREKSIGIIADFVLTLRRTMPTTIYLLKELSNYQLIIALKRDKKALFRRETLGALIGLHYTGLPQGVAFIPLSKIRSPQFFAHSYQKNNK